MKIKFKKTHQDAVVPAYSHPGDAGIDFFALEKTIIKAGDRAAVRTGISVEIPDGYAGFVWDKSGISIRGGLKTLGGVIDAGYRGEVLIGLINLGSAAYTLEAGHKVAQMIIQKIERITFEEHENLSETSRGQGGFGSTGT